MRSSKTLSASELLKVSVTATRFAGSCTTSPATLSPRSAGHRLRVTDDCSCGASCSRAPRPYLRQHHQHGKPQAHPERRRGKQFEARDIAGTRADEDQARALKPRQDRRDLPSVAPGVEG